MADGFVSKIGALIKSLRKKPEPAQPDQDIRSPEAEAISKNLPAMLMPRGAVEKKRQQLKDLDAMMKE